MWSTVTVGGRLQGWTSWEPKEIGITRQRVQQLVTEGKSKTFPTPVAHLECGYIFNAEDIKKFAVERAARKLNRLHFERTEQWLYPDPS